MESFVVTSPGGHPEWIESKRLLACNQYGSIVLSKDQYGVVTAKISPSDESDFSPVEATEIYDIEIGAVSNTGYILSSLGDLQFNTLKPNSIPGPILKHSDGNDNFVAVAVGESFFAIGTSQKRISLYTIFGTLIHSFTLSGHIVSMSAAGNLLLVVSGFECKYELFNVDERSIISSGLITSNRPIKWTGIDSDTQSAYAITSEKTLIRLTNHFGPCWMPVLSLPANDLSTHPVSVSSTGLTVINMTKSLSEAVYETKTELEFASPTLDSTQNEIVLAYLDYATTPDPQDFDKAILRQYIEAIRDDKFLRATQLAMLLKTEAARRAAVQYADSKGHENVAQRLHTAFENMSDSSSEEDESEDVSSEELAPFERTEEVESETEDSSDNVVDNVPAPRRRKKEVVVIEEKPKEELVYQYEDEYYIDDVPPQKENTEEQKVAPKKKKKKTKTVQVVDDNEPEESILVEEKKERSKKPEVIKKPKKLPKKKYDIKREKAVGLYSLEHFSFSK